MRENMRMFRLHNLCAQNRFKDKHFAWFVVNSWKPCQCTVYYFFHSCGILMHDYLFFCFFFMQVKGKWLKSHTMELTKFLKELAIISSHRISIFSISQVLIYCKKKSHLFLFTMIFDRVLLWAWSTPQVKSN